MHSKISFPLALVLVGIMGSACASIIVISNGYDLSHTQNIVFAREIISPLPVRIIIPKIGVDASIEDLGLALDGTMAVTAGPSDVAWFDLGPVPGAIGSAVIAGHEGWKDGIPAVFDDLNELNVGDKIYIENSVGSTTLFVVQSSGIYDPSIKAPNVFFSDDGKAHLNLITCNGVWSAVEKSYIDRLVVFADEETN